ncbi:hypothetical protein [Thiohalomonas denitrificans]|uniref:Uncharacterized protein n=1 Tax=Thiohalomonas denitrificans TaxID=415747 RepID=A0A1G5QAW3_9GAMM|nr:hypothetical protein [Thiohalomonas denitrificans]SCZ58964.1 hypothetical protein SAMN03097708_01748 [Thiohalomonas denitrificans]
MDWMKLGMALLIGAMIVLLLPRAKQMMAQSREATNADWKGLLVPLLAVIGFVILLILAVR